eukprot:283630_1
MEWIQTNDARIPQLNKRGFINEISAYCADNKIKGALDKVWKQYHKEQEEEPRPRAHQVVSNIFDPIQYPQFAGKTDKIMEWITANGTRISELLCNIIDTSNDPKLDGKKDKIREWVQKNESRIPQLEIKAFRDEISDYCHDKGIKRPLHKVWKQYVAEMSEVIDQSLQKQEEESKYETERDGDDIGSESESSESESCYAAEHDRELHTTEQMPTYIHRAIWFRSNDEHLERLVDQAVEHLLLQRSLWNDATFITNLYDSRQFEKNVERIGNNFEFFATFVQTTFKRQLLLDAMHWIQQEDDSESDDEQMSPISRVGTHTHKVYHIPKRNESEQKEQKEDLDGACGYHIYSAHVDLLRDDILKLDVNASQNMSSDFEWAVWRSCGKALRARIKNAGSTQKTYGLWEILNCDKMIQWNERGNQRGLNPGVPINHLNIVYELLQRYSPTKIENMTELGEDELQNTYCVEPYNPRRVSIDIYIHGEHIKGNTPHYILTWWNCKERYAACNAIAIKNMTGVEDMDKVKEKYYIRFKVSELNYRDEQRPIEWQWYDNNGKYKHFSDYKYDAETEPHKEGLLHKQIEATYQANIDENFPWNLWFDKFNGAQISHLATINGRNQMSRYLMRFTRLSCGSELKIISNVAQVAVNKYGSLFERNLRRLKDDKNSLKAQYSGSEPFAITWLKTYQLVTETQQKYFWAFMLSIATKIKLMGIGIENQLVTIPIQEHAQKPTQNLFPAGVTSEVAQEQQDALLYKGFLVPPVLGEAITDVIQSDAN